MSYGRETLVLHSMAPDLLPEDAPLEAWTSADNVVFRNQETVAARQDRDVFTDLVQSARTMVYVEPFDSGYWVIANEAGIWAHDGASAYEITPAGWAPAAGTWTSCVVNGLAVVNVSTADPVYWPGTTPQICVPLPDWPAGGRCLAMRAHKNFLFAVGMVSEGGQRVRWSDAAEAGIIPQEWTPAADNFAGFVDLAPLSSSCVEAMTLRDDFVVYKRESIWSFTFVGGNTVFQVRKLWAERGAAATNGVCRGPNDEHLFIGSDGDIYLTDGVNMRSVLDGRAQRTFYADFNEPSDGVYSAATLTREKMGIVAFPRAGHSDGTRALLFDFASGDISFRDMPAVRCMAEGRMLEDVGQANEWDADAGSWDADPQAWNHRISAASVEDVLMGTVAGQKLLAGGALALAASVEKSGLAFGDPQRRKVLARVWPKVSGRAGDQLTIRVGGQEISGGSVSLSPPAIYEIGRDQAVDVFATGRFLTLIVEADDQVAPWRVGSVDVEIRGAGKW